MTNLSRCKIFVDINLCKGCGICIAMCPRKVLTMSSDISPRGFHYPILNGECIGCHICEFYCPDFAIRSVCGD